METRRTVVLVGDSLLMAGVEASLRDRPELDVVHVDAILPDVMRRLNAFHPDVVIFDLAAPESRFVSSLLKEHPDLPLIGLDLDGNMVLVLHGQQHLALTA